MVGVIGAILGLVLWVFLRPIFRGVGWIMRGSWGRGTKKGKLTTSHRYNPVPLLRSRPGGVPGELVV